MKVDLNDFFYYKFENLRIVSNTINRRNMKMNKNNTSGFTGVSLSNCKKYWVASVRDLNRKSIYECVSIEVYGSVAALEMAVKARVKMIEVLNSNGAEYSHNHGGKY